MSPTDAQAELAQRENDGIRVRLLWSRDDGAVAVQVRHLRTDRTFELPVEPDRALEAYYHPFAFTPRVRQRVLETVS